MQFYQFSEKTKFFLATIFDYAAEKVKNIWKRAVPIIERIIQTGIAVYTSFSAYKSTVELLPVLLSGGLTILATAPLLNYFLPAFLFNATAMFLILGTISGLVGYYKFRELKLRKELDAQTKNHGKAIIKINRRLNNISREIYELKELTHAENLSAVGITGYSLRPTSRRNQPAAANNIENIPRKRVHCTRRL